MTRIFNSEIECSNEVQRLKLLQKHHPLRPEVIPTELANSSQWIVWAYEVGRRKNGKFGPDKIAYQARDPRLKSSRWHASDWSDLTTALQCVKDNPHIDGIGYFFSKNDGLIGTDFDNCRDPKTGRIRKEYQFWIDKLDGYAEVSPSGTGIKVWVKGIVDSRCFRNDESTGFRIPNFAGGIIEIYRRGQYFTVTTQVLEGFERIKPAQEELDVLSEFYLSHTHNNLLGGSGGWVSGEQAPNVVENLPKSAKARLGKSTINDIQFSSDGTRLAVASGIGIWIYDAHTAEQLFLLAGHTRNVTSVIFSPSGRKLASGGQDGTIRLWDVPTGKHLKTHTKEGVSRVVFSPDRCTFATVEWGGPLRLWDIATGKLCQTFTMNVEKRDVFIASLKEGWSQTLTMNVGERWAFSGAVFSPDGCTLATLEGEEDVWDGDLRISLWDIATGMHLKILTKANSLSYGLHSLAFSPDGGTLANDVGIEGFWELWDVTIGARLKTFHLEHTDNFVLTRSLAFSPDGNTLAAGCSNSTIYLWNVDTGKHAKTFTGHTAEISNLCFSPDGNTLASGCKDGTVLLWDIDSTSGETILTEENSELRNRASQIQQICTERGITTLVHFTRIENLHSILQQGLLGRSILETHGQQFLFNDHDRVDGHKEAICLSISFPNYQMFYSIREQKKETQEANDSQWIVLLLDVKVLWELDCAFCQNNAARKAISRTSLEDRKSPEALKGMFGDFYNIRHQDLSIPQDYPTHPQAEVLVFDPIPAQYIEAIHFWDAAAQERWLPNITDANYEISCINRHYFEPRHDYEIWRPANFNSEGIPLSYLNSDDGDYEPNDDLSFNENDIHF